MAPTGPTSLHPDRSDDEGGAARREVMVGSALVLVTVVGGIYFYFRPQAGEFDHWIRVSVTNGSWFTTVTTLRYPFVVILGSMFFAAVTVTRNRARALACLIAPSLALITSELLIKPLVGRTLGAAPSYPSGSTVGAAALATAAVLVSPSRWRPITAVVAALFGIWMAVAVVALGWHFPSDAVAGLVFGVGVVLLVDGSASEAHRRLTMRWLHDRRSRGAD
jgi:membrane-associated phospholipid phosphatase